MNEFETPSPAAPLLRLIQRHCLAKRSSQLSFVIIKIKSVKCFHSAQLTDQQEDKLGVEMKGSCQTGGSGVFGGGVEDKHQRPPEFITSVESP